MNTLNTCAATPSKTRRIDFSHCNSGLADSTWPKTLRPLGGCADDLYGVPLANDKKSHSDLSRPEHPIAGDRYGTAPVAP